MPDLATRPDHLFREAGSRKATDPWGPVGQVASVRQSPFTCPGFFLGAMNIPAAPDNPWPLSLMFSGFVWPGGGMTEFATIIPFIGQVDFRFRLINNSDNPQPFAIKLIGLELL